MKKLLLIASLMLGLAGINFAQTKPAKKPKAAKTATTTAPVPASTGTATPVKKDGTPDMRYKANKDAKPAPATTHLKKDGTADKRFKENKATKKP